MERSGSQKVLLVLSILNIVVAVLGLIVGIMAIAGGALFGAVDSSEAASALQGTGATQGQVAAGVSLAGLFLLLACVVELIEGILGVRAANDNQKIMPVWVLALIGVIISFIGAMSLAIQGQFLENPSMVGSLIGSALMFWIANNIKRQAGK
jgi:uncharacterized membrane protein